MTITLEGEGMLSGQTPVQNGDDGRLTKGHFKGPVGVGHELKFEFTGKWNELAQSGAVEQALDGRFGEALTTLGDKVTVKIASTNFTTSALNTAFEVKVPYGVNLEIEGKRKDAEDGAWDYEGSATGAVRWAKELVPDVNPYEKPLQAPQRRLYA